MNSDWTDAEMFRVAPKEGPEQLGLTPKDGSTLLVDLVAEGPSEAIANYRPPGGPRPGNLGRAVLIRWDKGDDISYSFPSVGALFSRQDASVSIYYYVITSTDDDSTRWSEPSRTLR